MGILFCLFFEKVVQRSPLNHKDFDRHAVGESDTQVTLKLLGYINLLQLNVTKNWYFIE